MPFKDKSTNDYESLARRAKKGETKNGDQNNLKPAKKQNHSQNFSSAESLINPRAKNGNAKPDGETGSNGELKASKAKETTAESVVPAAKESVQPERENYVTEQRLKKQRKKLERDYALLNSDYWLARNGHILTYIGLFLFSVLVLYRPYEMTEYLEFLSSSAFYFAAATLILFVPTQLTTEGTLTTFSTEVKCILLLTLLGIITMPIAKIPIYAWATFNDTFIKAVLMFVVMVNVVRTRRRLMGLIWLSLSVGVYLSYSALDLYFKGELKAEGYRVAVEVGGLFGNPNDMALHLVTMTPIAIVLGIATRSTLMRVVYFVIVALFIAGNMVTFSRGGFIGLIVTSAIIAWKVGRRQRLKVSLASIVVGALFILAAPGNYGLRLLSIFIPGLDPVGSSNQRQELLKRSVYVTIRNPWGIGMGNSPVMNDFNLQWHNTYTQVASELSILGLLIYLIFLISPFRKLGAIERALFAKEKLGWSYYLSIGLQASIIGFMVSSFFVSVAYNWFVYYLIAYAVAYRRIYQIENNLREELENDSFLKTGKSFFGWQTA